MIPFPYGGIEEARPPEALVRGPFFTCFCSFFMIKLTYQLSALQYSSGQAFRLFFSPETNPS